MKPPPELIALDPDDYHAKDVGWNWRGRQFFATTPFVPALETAGREFDALFIFNAAGDLLEAQIDDLGTRADLISNSESARLLRNAKMVALGQIMRRRIWIKPFAIQRFGVEFGFILRSPEEYLRGDENPDEVAAELERVGWRVNLEPGNYMSFVEPWSDGVYET